MTLGRISRRRMLMGLGGFALALPWLPSVMHAQPKPPQSKRFIFVFCANGQKPADWYPDDNAMSYTQLGPNLRAAPLVGSGAISTVIGPEFDSLKSKLTLFRGLDVIPRDIAAVHNPMLPLSGALSWGTETIDQLLARSSKLYPSPPTLRSLHQAVRHAADGTHTVSLAKIGNVMQEVEPESNPAASYQKLFGGLLQGPSDEDRARAQLKLGVLDRVRGEYELLHKHPRLGGEDRLRLQAHAELIHDLHARLVAAAPPPPSCSPPGAPAVLDDTLLANIPQLTTDSIDVLVAAVRCDRTRVATLMLCPSSDMRDFSFLGGPSGQHHELSHVNGASNSDTAYIQHWYSKQVADLLSKLDTVEDPETGTTYLDNSLVYWGNEDGVNAHDPHEHMSMQVMLAGSAAGYFQPGRLLDYRHHGTPIGSSVGLIPTDDLGHPYNSLLLSILEAMGLDPADYEQAGARGWGDYGPNFADQYDVAAGQQSLPFLRS
jgi:hypothetical protein